jgi:hypothetical protein
MILKVWLCQPKQECCVEVEKHQSVSRKFPFQEDRSKNKVLKVVDVVDSIQFDEQ